MFFQWQKNSLPWRSRFSLNGEFAEFPIRDREEKEGENEMDGGGSSLIFQDAINENFQWKIRQVATPRRGKRRGEKFALTFPRPLFLAARGWATTLLCRHRRSLHRIFMSSACSTPRARGVPSYLCNGCAPWPDTDLAREMFSAPGFSRRKTFATALVQRRISRLRARP